MSAAARVDFRDKGVKREAGWKDSLPFDAARFPDAPEAGDGGV